MTSKYDLPGVYDAHKREMRERMEAERWPRAVVRKAFRPPNPRAPVGCAFAGNRFIQALEASRK